MSDYIKDTLLQSSAKLITCILPKGRAFELQQALLEEKGISGANFHGARGVGRFSLLSARGIGEQQEKEILEVIVPEETADELMEYMFFKAEMNHAHGGIIYMNPVPRSTVMTLPKIEETS